MNGEDNTPQSDEDQSTTLGASAFGAPSFQQDDSSLADWLSRSPLDESKQTAVPEPLLAETGEFAADPADSAAPPPIDDVLGLEDLYVTTTELDLPNRPDGNAIENPDDDRTLGTFNPTETHRIARSGDGLPPPLAVGLDLKFSTEPHQAEEPAWTIDDGQDQHGATPTSVTDYPHPDNPNTLRVTPNRSVRAPGQLRRAPTLIQSVTDLAERRSLWLSSAAATVAVAGLGLLAGGIFPGGVEPADVIADQSAETGSIEPGGLTTIDDLLPRLADPDSSARFGNGGSPSDAQEDNANSRVAVTETTSTAYSAPRRTAPAATAYSAPRKTAPATTAYSAPRKTAPATTAESSTTTEPSTSSSTEMTTSSTVEPTSTGSTTSTTSTTSSVSSTTSSDPPTTTTTEPSETTTTTDQITTTTEEGTTTTEETTTTSTTTTTTAPGDSGGGDD